MRQLSGLCAQVAHWGLQEVQTELTMMGLEEGQAETHPPW